MRFTVKSIFLVCPILAIATGGVLNGQSTGSAIVPTQLSEAPQIWGGNLGSYPVAAGDLVYIYVAGSPELTRSYRISSEGQIALPLMTEGLPINGLTPDKVAQAVSKALVEKRILIGPIVFAEVLEYRSRLVSVVGAVKAPTTLQAVGDMKLLDAIARAQGLAPEAGPEIIVTRSRAGEDKMEPIRISVKALFSGNDPSLNVPLHGGEEIAVPEAPKLYIVGNVRLPGVFPLNELDGSTVMKALALSQGTISFTAKKAYIYRTMIGSAQRQEIVVQLNQILHRKSSDVPLQGNDILYIPENSKMRLSAALLSSFSGAGSSMAALAVFH